MVAPIVLQLLKDKSNTDANLSEWQTYYVSPETCLDIKNYYCPLKLFDSTKN